MFKRLPRKLQGRPSLPLLELLRAATVHKPDIAWQLSIAFGHMADSHLLGLYQANTLERDPLKGIASLPRGPSGTQHRLLDPDLRSAIGERANTPEAVAMQAQLKSFKLKTARTREICAYSLSAGSKKIHIKKKTLKNTFFLCSPKRRKGGGRGARDYDLTPYRSTHPSTVPKS